MSFWERRWLRGVGRNRRRPGPPPARPAGGRQRRAPAAMWPSPARGGGGPRSSSLSSSSGPATAAAVRSSLPRRAHLLSAPPARSARGPAAAPPALLHRLPPGARAAPLVSMSERRACGVRAGRGGCGPAPALTCRQPRPSPHLRPPPTRGRGGSARGGSGSCRWRRLGRRHPPAKLCSCIYSRSRRLKWREHLSHPDARQIKISDADANRSVPSSPLAAWGSTKRPPLWRGQRASSALERRQDPLAARLDEEQLGAAPRHVTFWRVCTQDPQHFLTGRSALSSNARALCVPFCNGSKHLQLQASLCTKAQYIGSHFALQHQQYLNTERHSQSSKLQFYGLLMSIEGFLESWTNSFSLYDVSPRILALVIQSEV